jgi:predicted dehydrogenase
MGLTSRIVLVLVPIVTSIATTALAAAGPTTRFSTQTGPMRIAIVGMSHGHVEGLLHEATRRDDIKLVGCFEPNRERFDKLAAKYRLDASLYYGDLGKMLDDVKPEVVSVMTSIKDHTLAVDACAPRGIHLLVEKPLAFANEDARHMADLARANGVLLLTNYEPSWYSSVREAKRLVDSDQMSPLRKMVFRHGHRGPIEIGCAPEFLAWLTDPDQNGGGAIVDFGCYGAILATWMNNGERPLAVAASATTLKPAEYPRVDDDATIIVTYSRTTAVIEASWCWTHDNKEMDLYTDRGSIHAGKWDALSVREPDKPARSVKPPPMPPELENTWTYLRKVIRGECAVDPMSSLELNLTAVEILDAARADAKAHGAVGVRNP